MNTTEALMLIRVIRARCPVQQFDRDSPPVWAEVLSSVRLADALLAVKELGGRREFISTDDIEREVKRIRARRIEETSPEALLPPPELADDPRAELEWSRRARAAAADGRPIPG